MFSCTFHAMNWHTISLSVLWLTFLDHPV